MSLSRWFPFLVAACAFAADPLPFGVNDGGVDFVDLVKSTNRWTPVTGTVLAQDDNGWPLADAQLILFDLRRNMPWNGLDPWAVNPQVDGVYRFEFTGQATVESQFGTGSARVQNVAWDARANKTTGEMVVPSNSWLVGLKFTRTKRSPDDAPGTGITGLRVLRPGFDLSTTQVFTPETVAAYSQGFHHIRPMNLASTNNYTAMCGTALRVAQWDDRVRITDAFQGGLTPRNEECHSSRGHAWEYIVQLSNLAGSGIWINVPISADDDYVRKLALLLRDGNENTAPLGKDKPIYVEYSNEVWNGSFQSSVYNRAAAQRQGIDPTLRYVARTLEVARIFREVFGAAQMIRRVRPVVHWQYTQYLTIHRAFMAAQATLDEPLRNLIYGIGEAPYYTASDQSSAEAAIESLYRSSDSSRRHYLGWQTVAAYYGLHQVGYESGPSLDTLYGGLAARQPQIRPTMLRHFIENWFALGGEAVGFFTLRGGVTPFGDWFLVEDFDRLDTPRMQAAREILSAPAPEVTAGHLLPSSTGDAITFDPSQFTTEPFAAELAPDSPFTMCATGCTRVFSMYLLRGAAGRYSVSLTGVSTTDGGTAEVWIDGTRTGVLDPNGSVTFDVTAGLHGLMLQTASGRLQFGAGSRIRMDLTSGGGSSTAKPQAPTNLSLRGADGQITLRWAVVGGASSYRILRAASAAGPWETLDSSDANSWTGPAPNGTLQYYAIASVNAAGASPRSMMVRSMAAAAVPAAPQISGVLGDAGDAVSSAAGGLVLLSWDAVPNALTYTVSRAASPTGPTRVIATQLATEFRDYSSDVARNATYFYTVAANNDRGASPASSVAAVTTAPRGPEAPGAAWASSWPGIVLLTWTAPGTQTLSFNPTYRVRRAVSSDGPWSTLVDLNTCSFIDKTAEPGRTYWYRISTLKGSAESAPATASVAIP